MYSFGLKWFLIYDHVTPAEMVDKEEVSLIRIVKLMKVFKQCKQPNPVIVNMCPPLIVFD